MGSSAGEVSGSGAARRSLGRRLARLREASGVKATQLAKDKIVSRDKLWRIEHGQSPVKAGDVVALCWAYKADPATTDDLVAFSANTLEKTIYEKCRDVMPSWFGMYVELESFATVISSYQPDLVPGLLQTAEYARAIFEATRPAIPAQRIDRLVSTRIERAQNVITGPAHPTINAVLSEAVVSRQVGGRNVMAAQMDHLRSLRDAKQVSVSVLTWETGAHAAMEGAFTLLEFAADSDEPELGYQENRAGSVYIEPPEEVAGYREIFNAITEQSVPIEEYTA